MNQAFLGAEINKGYIDITISDKKGLLKKLVYFDVNESFNELVSEINKLFNDGIQVLHCGFVSTVLSENHWIHKVSSLDLNIQIHKVSSIDVLNEFKKLTNKSITTVLICNYLKSNTNQNVSEQFFIPDFEEIPVKPNKTKPTPLEFLKHSKDIVFESDPKESNLKINPKVENKEVIESEKVVFNEEIASIDFIEKQATNTIVNKSLKFKDSDIGNTLFFDLIIKESEKNLQNFFLDILEKSFPEAISFCEEKIPMWLVNLIYKYPNRKKLSKARLATVNKIVGKNHSKAINFIASIRITAAFEKNLNVEYLIKRICENLLNLDAEQNKIERFVKKSFDHPYLEKLSIISNIDRFLTLFLIEELGDIDRFETVEDMTTNFGVHFNERTFKLENKIKYSSYKAIINRISEKVIKNNSYFKQLYNQKIALRHSHNEAIEFIDFKLSRVIYGLLKSEKQAPIVIENKDVSAEEFMAIPISEIKISRDLEIKRKEKLRKMLNINKKQVAEIAKIAL